MTPTFDAAAFAAEIAAAEAGFANQRAAALAAGVSLSTYNRARKGHADLSHANWLQLRAWLDQRRHAAA